MKLGLVAIIFIVMSTSIRYICVKFKMNLTQTQTQMIMKFYGEMNESNALLTSI